MQGSKRPGTPGAHCPVRRVVRAAGGPLAAAWLAGVLLAGCGTTKMQRATEQLVLSDAVDQAVEKMNFSALKGRRVYLDTTQIKPVRGFDFVNAPYVIGSLREKLVRSGCLLEDDKSKAEVIVEARIGALGMDAHDVTYGIPSSRLLSTAASLLPNGPSIPVIPELALGKRSDRFGVAKLYAFAYEAKTHRPLWQSGTALAQSSARDMWVFGAGPFQSGTIREAPMFLGQQIHLPNLNDLPLIAEPVPLPGLPRLARRPKDRDAREKESAPQGRITDREAEPADGAPPPKTGEQKPADSKKTKAGAAAETAPSDSPSTSPAPSAPPPPPPPPPPSSGSASPKPPDNPTTPGSPPS